MSERHNYCRTAIVVHMDVDSLVSLRDAADMLGVSRQKVQQLIAEHRLPAVRIGGHWQLSVVDVERCGQTPRRSGRPLDPTRAWQVLRDAESAGRVHMPRSKAKHDAFWLANLVRRRATVRLLHGLDSLLASIQDELVGGGETAARLHRFAPLSSAKLTDGYATEAKADALVRGFGLVQGHGAEVNVRLRVVADEVWPFTSSEVVGPLVAALDMIDAPVDDRSVESALPIIGRYL
jgi:excisionase family DNA binding protein